ncbi:MAG: transposase [Planctomycetes bacterium]|nr:transposase [Planctomycetota bacterium]
MPQYRQAVIKTLKYEWLKRVPIIKCFDHLTLLCKEFGSWYNSWRPHMSLDAVRPAVIIIHPPVSNNTSSSLTTTPICC